MQIYGYQPKSLVMVRAKGCSIGYHEISWLICRKRMKLSRVLKIEHGSMLIENVLQGSFLKEYRYIFKTLTDGVDREIISLGIVNLF